MKRDLDIGQLRTFLAIAEHKNITHSANLLNLTQSAVSQQIKRLEEGLGSKLLIRSARGVALTQQGRNLLPKAISLVRANDEILTCMTDKKAAADIRLGVPQDVVCSLLPSALSIFHRAEPDIQITLVSATSRELIVMLNKGEIDLALTTDGQTDLEATVLFKKKLVWVGAINGVAYTKTPLPVAVGAENCPFRKAASGALAKNQIAWRPVTQVGSLEPVFATLVADIAVAPFLPGTLPHGTKVIDDELPDLPEFYLHLRKHAGSLSDAENRFCRVIVDEI